MTALLCITFSAVCYYVSTGLGRFWIAAWAAALFVFGYGAHCLWQPRPASEMRIGLAATDQRIGAVFDTQNTAEALAVARSYADRVAQQGRLTISDAYGRIVAEKPSSTAPDALLICDVVAGPGSTPYSRFGDWLGWASVALLIALLACRPAKQDNRPGYEPPAGGIR